MASPSTSNNNLGGRTLKRLRSLIGVSPQEGSSRLESSVPVAIDQVLSSDTTAKVIVQSPPGISPPTPSLANLSFNDEPMIADDTQEDPTIDEAAYEALIKDSKTRSRGRRLFDSYGLDIETSGLTVSRHSPDAVPKARVLRTEKAVRVRKVHNCCQCNKEFGSDPACIRCQHERCKQCPRYPPSRRHREKDDGAVKQPSAAATTVPSARPHSAASTSMRSQGSLRPASTTYLHMPNSINYQAMRPRPVLFNRLRQICCACDAHFNPPDAPRCAKCLHPQCSTCRQDFATHLRKRAREEEHDEAFGEQEDDMDQDADHHASAAQSPPEVPDMRGWHRSADVSVGPAQRRDCRECGSHFVCRLTACSICEHSRCMDCVRRKTRSESATSSEQRLSPSAGEIGAQGLRC